MPPKTATSARKRAAKPVAEPAPKPQPKAEKPLPPPLNAQSLAGVDGAVLARNLMEAGFRGTKLLGSAARRVGAATTMGTRRFSLMKGSAEGMLSKIIGTWPATVSLRAGPAPR